MLGKKYQACFDSRAFSLPVPEVCNYFIWRQQDAIRNSINSVGHVYFAHNELQGLNTVDLQNKLLKEKNVDWNDYYTAYKRGCCCYRGSENKWIIDTEIPVFTDDRSYIERFVRIGLYGEE